MKRSKGKRSQRLTRWLTSVRRWLQPTSCLPCVGLVVLGGCLTLIMMPDPPAGTKPEVAAAPEKSSLQVPKLPTIVVDAGHGGHDEGTKWRGISEKDMTLDVALRVERLLKLGGFPVLMTRRENIYLTLEERARLANQLSDAVFVSIHFNSDPTGSSSGIETYYARQKAPPDAEWTWAGFFNHPEAVPVENDTSEQLAGAVQAAIMTHTEARNRGIHSSNFYVCHHTRCPAILVEGGFLSSVFEAQLLSLEQYRETLAQGIVEGVMSYQKSRLHPGTVGTPKLALLTP